MFHAKYLSSSYFNFFKRGIFLSFYYGGPILTPGLLFEQTW
jgi:hypothetical protein